MTAALDTRQRIAAGFVVTVLWIACVAWWIGVPALTLWGLSQLTDDGTTHFVAGLIGVPMMLVVTAPILLWINALYLRITGAAARAAAEEEETGWRPQLRGPLEPIMFISLGVAFVALCIWFFFIAQTAPSSIL